MDLSSNSSSRGMGGIQRVKNSIRAAIQDSLTSGLSVGYDIGMWLMLLIAAPITGLAVSLIGVILFLASGILSFILFPISGLIETLSDYILMLMFILMPLAVGFTFTAAIYPTDDDEEPFAPDLFDINYPILLMGPILIFSTLWSDLLLYPGSWSGFVEVGLGFLLITSIIYRSSLYGLTHAIKTTDENSSGLLDTILIIYPGLISFVGFSWITWAIQHRMASIVSTDLAQGLWELPQIIPGVIVTQSHITQVPIILAVSMFGLGVVSMLQYRWSGVKQTGSTAYYGAIDVLDWIYSTGIDAVIIIITVPKIVILKLLSVLRYITLTSGK